MDQKNVPEGVATAELRRQKLMDMLFGHKHGGVDNAAAIFSYVETFGAQQREAGRREGAIIGHRDALSFSQRSRDNMAAEITELLAVRAAFYTSMLKAYPGKSHDEIQAEIEKVAALATRQPVAPELTEIPQAWIDENLHSYFSYSGNRDSIMWASLEDIALFARAVEKEARAASPVTPVSQDLATQLQVAKVLPPVSALTDEQRATLSRLIACAEILNQRPRPMCRDCADEDGICPNSGLDCDMRKLFSDFRALLAASPKVAVVEPVAGQFAHVEDMRLLIARLSLALKKINPDHELPAKATAYLQKHGLIGSPLRTEIVEQVSDDKRDAALEEAAVACEATATAQWSDHSGTHDDGWQTRLDIAENIRALKSPQPINHTGDAK